MNLYPEGWVGVIMYPCYPCRDGRFRGTLGLVTSIGGAEGGVPVSIVCSGGFLLSSERLEQLSSNSVARTTGPRRRI